LSGISVAINHQNHIHGNNNSIPHRINNFNYYTSNSLTNDNTYNNNSRHNDDDNDDHEYYNDAHHHVREDDDEHQDHLFQDDMHNYPSYSIVKATIEDAMNNIDDELFFGDLDDTDNTER
jgi:ABC-type Zn2+ transport system substrate-binding protein/surface adhesin